MTQSDPTPSGPFAPAWTGGQATSRARCLLAPNPGPMTLDGTNTWLLAEPGAERALLVDPGPADPRHQDAIQRAVAERGLRIEVVLLTHTHYDHAESAVDLARRTGARLLALDPSRCPPASPVRDGEQLMLDGLELEVRATPGHTSDSLCCWLPQDSALLTGDTVLGRGTSVVAHPDGSLGEYLDSLDRLLALVTEREVAHLLPGHGPMLGQPHAVLSDYRSHRRSRLAEVRAALGDGAATAREVVAVVYAEVDPSLWPAAELSVAAQLEYLRCAD